MVHTGRIEKVGVAGGATSGSGGTSEAGGITRLTRGVRR